MKGAKYFFAASNIKSLVISERQVGDLLTKAPILCVLKPEKSSRPVGAFLMNGSISSLILATVGWSITSSIMRAPFFSKGKVRAK